MKNSPEAANAELLVVLQKGLPIDARPFARIGEALGMSEADVLGRLRTLFEEGIARRFGAVFESQSLGYLSTLCAVDVPAADLVAAQERIAPHPGITHCYEREGHPNLWFTMTAPEDGLETELARVSAALGPYQVMNLPALKKFKIEAVFGKGEKMEENAGVPRTDRKKQAPLSERERVVVRCLQSSIPVVEDPFGAVARQVNYDPAELLDLLKRWKRDGIIRRIALVVRHHKLGFSANSMCVWPVAPAAIEAAGHSMGRNPHVTHCYERPSSEVFPYNLYAMIHAQSREEAVGIFQALGRDAGLTGGKMMWSVREFKKSSPVFFCEPPPKLGTPPS